MALIVFLFIINSFLYPSIISPSDSDSLTSIHVLIEWEQRPYIKEYNIQISETNNFDPILIDTVSNIPLFICKNNLTWDSQYFVRVQSVVDEIPQLDYYDTTNFYILNPQYTDVGTINTVTHNENEYFEGITIFGLFNHHRSIAFDKNGNEIWNTGDHNNFFMTTIDRYGNFNGFKDEGNVNKPIKFNFKNDILWISTDHGDRHEFREITENHYMYIEPKYQFGVIPNGEWTNSFIQMGYLADGVTQELNWKAQQICIKDHLNQKIWEWDPFEYFSMNDFDLYGTWFTAVHNGYYDWTHSNSFWYSEPESAIYLSSRHLSRITKIDYPSGNIIWNIGPGTNHNLGEDNLCDEIGFSFQHHIQELDDGSLLFFDNGNRSNIFRSTEMNESRILRLRIDSLDCEIVWEYMLPGTNYSNSMSGVSLLDNGNYLIATRSDSGKIIEVNNNKETIWEADLNVDLHETTPGIYRAFRVPSIFPQAYSVVFNNYENILNNKKGIILGRSDDLSVEIYNEGGYGQEYSYSLSDSLGLEFFNKTGTIFIPNNEKYKMSFPMPDYIHKSNLSNNLIFNISPTNHSYAYKSYNIDLLVFNSNINKGHIISTFPNPSKSVTTCKIYLLENENVTLQVFDILGNKIEQSKEKFYPQGLNHIKWNPRNNPSGVYLLQIITDSFTEVKKLIVIK